MTFVLGHRKVLFFGEIVVERVYDVATFVQTASSLKLRNIEIERKTFKMSFIYFVKVVHKLVSKSVHKRLLERCVTGKT